LAGKWLDLKLDEPLIMKIKCAKSDYPAHFISGVVPVFSAQMIEQFRAAGIDNFQLFPIHLVSTIDGHVWPNYFALNVLGMIEAIDAEASTGKTLMGGDMYGDGVPPLEEYTKIIIDSSKVNGALMFRDIRSPADIIFDYKVVDFLKGNKPPEGWRIKVKKLESKTT
jgi:hypothetical protein